MQISRYLFGVVFFLSFRPALFSQNTLTIGSTTVTIDTVYTNLDVPWEIVYGPDNMLWVTERKGIVSRIDPVNKTKNVILDLTASVMQWSESGLLGLALHPDFPSVSQVFLVYTYDAPPNMKERLVKYTYSNAQLVNPQVLLDSIKANVGHDGSRLQFLPDKTLLMTTGEAQNGALAQNMNSVNGKILRLNTDGSVPADNPFQNSYVYTSGHRNPQGLTLAPNGIVYSSEHGPVNDDEFQIIEKGRNYGWPDVQGLCDTQAELQFCQQNNVKEPMIDWYTTYAVNDICWYNNNSFPEFDNKMLMTTLKAKKLVVISLNAAGTASVSESSYLANMFGRLRAVCTGPSAEIYLATNGADAANVDAGTHSVLVIRPPLPAVSIKENETELFKIYPSVTRGNLTISGLKTIPGTVTVRNISDAVVKSFTLENAEQRIDLSDLRDGLYFLHISNGGSPGYYGKVIVAKD